MSAIQKSAGTLPHPSLELSACRTDAEATADAMILANPHPPIGGPNNHPGNSSDRPLWVGVDPATIPVPTTKVSYPL